MLYRQLNDSEPFGGVFLIPDAIYIDGAGSLQYLIPLALRIGEEFAITLVQFVVRTVVLEADGFLYRRQFVELDECGVGTRFLHRLAVFDGDIGRRIFRIQFTGEAEAGLRTFAT